MKKKILIIITIIFSIACLTGCKKNKINKLTDNSKKIELTGNLVTYKAYYHNVIEIEKKKGSGITHWFEIDRKLFAEYTGTLKLGIDLSKVKIEIRGNTIDVFIPKAEVIGEPNIDRDDFKAENFIESKEGLNKNQITLEDSNEAFMEAQKNMKEFASTDKDLLKLAQERSKSTIEQNIANLSGISKKDYTINWILEKYDD